jgi:hypothetical protein
MFFICDLRDFADGFLGYFPSADGIVYSRQRYA